MKQYIDMSRDELLRELAGRDAAVAETQRRLEDDYRSLFTGVNLALAELEVIWDEDGRPADFRYLHINHRFEEESGLNAADVVGRTVRETLPALDDWWFETYGKAAISGEPISLVNFGCRTNRTYEVYAARLQSGNILVVFKDISDRRELEDALVRVKRELELANELLEQKVSERTAELVAAVQAQESFSYSVSHDLRTPLRHMNSFTSMLMEDFGASLPPRARDCLNRIRAASTKMGATIDHLLDLSRVGVTELRREEVDLSDLARSTLLMLKETQPERRVEQVVERGLVVPGDGGLLRQLLENLLGNAWKYTSKKPYGCIQFGRMWMSGQPVFFVRDNGTGFDMRYHDKLFRAFERLHGADFEGAGIGLATAQRIVQRHGGRIWSEGRIGEGATFYFTIPQSQLHTPHDQANAGCYSA